MKSDLEGTVNDEKKTEWSTKDNNQKWKLKAHGEWAGSTVVCHTLPLALKSLGRIPFHLFTLAKTQWKRWVYKSTN